MPSRTMGRHAQGSREPSCLLVVPAQSTRLPTLGLDSSVEVLAWQELLGAGGGERNVYNMSQALLRAPLLLTQMDSSAP